MEELGFDPLIQRRETLRRIFAETLKAIDVRSVVRQAVQCDNAALRISDLIYPFKDLRRILVIAIGKAAVPGAETLLEMICAGRPAEVQLQAIVVGPGEVRFHGCEIECWPGSHPIPDASSRAAALRIMELLRETTPQDAIIFLISGGASAMVELPLDESINTEDVAGFYRALVHSGLTIAEMNTLRKHASAVKGGRLAALAPRAAKCTLLISDVPDAMLDVIGSGPTLPDSSTREQCWRLMRRPELTLIPQRVRALLESTELPETPKSAMECFRNAEFRVILSTATMLSAAAEACERNGFHAIVDNTCDDWDYRDAAKYMLERARLLHKDHARLCLISGGEVTVQVSGEPGQGGRNQQFALFCAGVLQNCTDAISVLSAGTDGIDGNSPAAGAIVDATSAHRAHRDGFDLDDSLRRFDAYSLLGSIGDAILTGPTGNNVRDLRIVMAQRNEPTS